MSSTSLEKMSHKQWEEAYLDSSLDFDDVRRNVCRTLHNKRLWVYETVGGGGAERTENIPTYHLNFDGIDDKITIPASVSMNNLPLSNFTVEWSGKFIKTWNGFIVGKINGNNLTEGWYIFNSSFLGKIFFAVIGDNGNGWNENDYTLADNNAHHYEFSWNQALQEIKLFIDGIEQIKSGDFIIPITSYFDDSMDGVSLGGYIEFDNFNMQGNFGWVRISNIIRHTSNFIPPSLTICPAADANTALRLAMDEGTGAIVNDTSGNNNNGSIGGAIWEKD